MLLQKAGAYSLSTVVFQRPSLSLPMACSIPVQISQKIRQIDNQQMSWFGGERAHQALCEPDLLYMVHCQKNPKKREAPNRRFLRRIFRLGRVLEHFKSIKNRKLQNHPQRKAQECVATDQLVNLSQSRVIKPPELLCISDDSRSLACLLVFELLAAGT